MLHWAQGKFVNTIQAISLWSFLTAPSWALDGHFSRYTSGSAMSRMMGGSQAVSDVEFRIFEGEVSQSQQGVATEEKRLQSSVYQFLSLPLGETFGLHFTVELDHEVSAREESGSGNISRTDWTQMDADPRAIFHVKTPTQVYLFGGMGYKYLPKYSVHYEVAGITGATRFGEAKIIYPVVGLAKKTSTWQGSIYGILGRSSERSFETLANIAEQAPIAGSEPVYQATTYGLTGSTNIGSASLDMDISSVQAGEGGPKSDDGTTVNEDYNQMAFQLAYSFVESGLAYRSLSYSSNAYMSLDRIAQWRLHAGVKFGSESQFFRAGLLASMGHDRQSLTEFNASYEFMSYGAFLSLGIGI